ncbi:MAG: hypothetical protein OWS03_00780 [Alicyclobacillaceae bacterium]|nr:hypothetical protein [Alicyclobacillaceae bacterium]
MSLFRRRQRKRVSSFPVERTAYFAENTVTERLEQPTIRECYQPQSKLRRIRSKDLKKRHQEA